MYNLRRTALAGFSIEGWSPAVPQYHSWEFEPGNTVAVPIEQVDWPSDAIAVVQDICRRITKAGLPQYGTLKVSCHGADFALSAENQHDSVELRLFVLAAITQR